MLYIGKIDLKRYACVADNISTEDVIITDRQIEHILAGHNQAEHVNVIASLSAAVSEPDYILKDAAPRTAVVLKRFIGDNDAHYRVILKLAADDERHPCNSIITAFYISEKKWRKYPRNKEVLYKSPKL